MLIKKFFGIRNLSPEKWMEPGELAEAFDVVCTQDGKLRSACGTAVLRPSTATDLFVVGDKTFAVLSNGDFVQIGGTDATLAAGIFGNTIRHVVLPTGHVVVSDGVKTVYYDGNVVLPLAVDPLPDPGSATPIAGSLTPGTYRYAITRVRIHDGVESPPVISEPLELNTGGVVISALPYDEEHRYRLYITQPNGSEFFLAAETAATAISYAQNSINLSRPCQTLFLSKLPASLVMATWRGRLLAAEGSVLWASQTFSPHYMDPRRDFIQLTEPITLIAPVTRGVYVGTESALYFLSGESWAELTLSKVLNGKVWPDSAVTTTASHTRLGKNNGMSGLAVILRCGNNLVHAFEGGIVDIPTLGTYDIRNDQPARAAILTLYGEQFYWYGNAGFALLHNTRTGETTHSTELRVKVLTQTYAVNETALLTLTQDAKNCVIDFGAIALDKTQVKKIDAILLTRKCTKPCVLRISDGVQTHSYVERNYGETGRIIVGRGLRASYIRMALTGYGPFALDLVELLIKTANERRKQ